MRSEKLHVQLQPKARLRLLVALPALARARGVSGCSATGSSRAGAGSGARTTRPATADGTAAGSPQSCPGRSGNAAADTESCRPPRAAWPWAIDWVDSCGPTGRPRPAPRTVVSIGSRPGGRSRSADTSARCCAGSRRPPASPELARPTSALALICSSRLPSRAPAEKSEILLRVSRDFTGSSTTDSVSRPRRHDSVASRSTFLWIDHRPIVIAIG